MKDTILMKFILLLVKLSISIVHLISIVYVFKKPKKCPPVTDKILLYPAGKLVTLISQKHIKSEQVMKAYIARVNEVNPLINAVVQNRFQCAINDARKVDEMINTSTLSSEELLEKYPLLGLPLSVKESIAVSGCSNAAGKVFPKGKIATKDATAVELCKSAGAIPFLVSNTPELCVSSETFNRVTGRTSNPYDDRRTCGGSSGGEGALLGAAATLVGLGSDIFGSLRLPAHFCGVWSHKPSPRIISIEGHYPTCTNTKEWENFFNIGPMTRYASDLPLMLKVLTEQSYKSKLKLNEKVDLKTVTFYYLNEKMYPFGTRMNDDVNTFIKKLVRHLSINYPSTVKKFANNTFRNALESAVLKIFSCGDVEGVIENKGQAWIRETIRFITRQSPITFDVVVMHVLNRLINALPNTIIKRSEENITVLKSELINILGSHGVLIAPCFPTAAFYHHQTLSGLLDYSSVGIFNTLGFPVTSCPLGLNSKGLPIGVQIIAAPNNDRLSLAVGAEIETAFGGWVPPSN